MSKQTKNQEQGYRITLKGLLSIYLQEAKASEVYNAIELYCRRNNRGIAINEDNTLDFVEMQQVKEAK
jgi:hypothetical protein